MEIAIAGNSNVYYSAFENTFDDIQSPTYMDFNGEIAEPRDSFFDHKEEDLPASKGQKNINNCSKLPSDFEEDFIRPLEVLGISSSFSNKQNFKTSTPFRIEGVEPMPWRSNSNVSTNVASPATKQKLKTKPFSFDERNKQLQQRKAHRIKTILLAEKDARKFRANPVPNFLRKDIANSERATSVTETRNNRANSNNLATTAPPRFKARSPKVLRRPPFQPILPKQPLVPPPKIILNSELRAKERQHFDNLIKEKERLDKELRQLREAAAKKREEEEILRMRKAMVPKAQPIRKFKCVTNPVAKRPLTECVTPIVIKRQRR